MTRAALALLCLTALPLYACVDDMGGDPLPEGTPPGWRVGAATEAEMAIREAELATCAAVADDFQQPQDPSGLAVGGIRVIDRDGAPTLEVELLNLNPRGFFAYPGMLVEVLDGDLALPEQLVEPDRQRYSDQYYGIMGCGRYVTRIPLPDAADVAGPITLRASATVLHAPSQDEWVFVLDPR